MGDLTWSRVWPWVWPLLLLAGGIVVTLWALRRIFHWIESRIGSDPRVDERILSRLHKLAATGIIIGAVYRAAQALPNRGPFEHTIHQLEPWVPATVLFLLWMLGGFYVARKAVHVFAGRAARTHSVFDDAIAAAILTPLHLLIVVGGALVWASSVPLPANVRQPVHLAAVALAVLAATVFLDGFVRKTIELRAATSNVLATSGGVLRSAARILVYIIGALMLLSVAEIPIAPLLTSLGIGSLAIGLALQKTLEDFIAGLLIAADQPIRVGDFVEVVDGSVSGTVLSIGWRTTRLRTREDTYIVVPNARLAQSTVVNRSMPAADLCFTVPVGIAYHSDLDAAGAATVAVARDIQSNDPRAVPGYEPRVTYEAFGDSSINFKVWMRARNWEGHFGMRDAFIRALHIRYAAEGITIPFPMRTLDLPPGTTLAVSASAPVLSEGAGNDSRSPEGGRE
ncbi:MAG: mechanosensitive ion channel family protein [Deltaproteobacteria bacterium]|nr:mechanosensitive ion channel family protein [Deltaproteobacteria bacterium]MCB9788431.1 mechanosensitive ion channel family protein [Deltaproteobacteria bacterium]